MDTLARTEYLQFVRLPSFERSAAGLLEEEDVRALEMTLLKDPRAGAVVPGGAGIRKVRVGFDGRGKRGGGRVIYLYVEVRRKIYLLLAYPKNEQANLTPLQQKRVRELVTQLVAESG